MTTTGDTATDDFPITWVEPDDAELTWEWDDMHMPTAVTPLAGDYNLLMGTVSISIVAVATTTLLVDLIYPLLDPRIRQR